MFDKHYLKILWANFIKLFSHLIAFTRLHTVFIHLSILSQRVCSQIYGNIFFFTDLLVQEQFFYKSHWFQLLSTKNDWSISLLLIPIILRTSQHFYLVCCWQRKKLRASMKTLLLLLAKSPNARKKIFLCQRASVFLSLLFCLRFLASWAQYHKFIGLESLKHLKKY